MVEGRGRPVGITLEAAKGQTQRWQPLLPHLQRVNAAAMATGRTRFTALLHHVDVDALERAFRRQRRAARQGSTLPLAVTCLTLTERMGERWMRPSSAYRWKAFSTRCEQVAIFECPRTSPL